MIHQVILKCIMPFQPASIHSLVYNRQCWFSHIYLFF